MQFLLRYMFVLLLFAGRTQAQFIAPGENKILYKSIKTTDSLLKSSTHFSVSERLFLVNAKLNNREELIQLMRNQLLLIDFTIDDLQSDLEALEQDLKQIKSEYAKMIFYAYRNRNSYDQMLFILSANSFYQSFKRLNYLRQYSDYRKKQARLIQEKKQKINNAIALLGYNKNKKQELIAHFEQLNKSLSEDKNTAIKLRKQLQSSNIKEEELTENEELLSILDTVFTEKQQPIVVNDNKYALRAKPFKKKVPGIQLDTMVFENNKGQLPWPITNSFVFNYFGKHPHPNLQGIMLVNNGIDICTKNNNIVRAIFKGKVVKIILLPGANSAVLLSHGNYYSLYANLNEVFVKNGDVIEHQQKIGKIYSHTDNKNFSKLQFQLWHNNKKIDPLLWLKKN